MDILDPTGVAETEVRTLARRPSTLAGCRIGVLDNSKPNADVLLGRIAALLVEHTGARLVSRWTKPGASRPAANLDEIAAESDVILTGSAD